MHARVLSATMAFAGFLLRALGGSADIYVDPLAGSSTSYNPSTRSSFGGTERAFGTLAEANAAAAAGKTVWIRGGTYGQQLAPQQSGNAASPITFRNYPGEQVFLTAAPAMALTGRSSIIIEGLTVQDTTWLEARGSHSNILRNCVFKRTPATGTTGNARFIQSHYNLIISNVFEAGQDNLLLIDASYNRVIRNTFREGRHSVLGIRCGDFNIVRSNYFSNSQQKAVEVYDCGTGTSAVANSFNSTRRNLFEYNVFADASSYYSTSGGNGIQYAGQDGLIRFNLFFNCNVGLSLGTYADEALFNTSNRVYHNVFYRNDIAGIALGRGTTNNVLKNNVIFQNLGCIPDGFATSPGQIVFRRPLSDGLRFENNCIFYLSSGQPVIEEEFGSGMTVGAFASAFPGVLFGTLETEPRFTNPTSYQFALQSDSPLIDAGAFLTTTTSAGSGTNLPVADVRWFFDGFGVPGERGDLVQLQGQTPVARVLRLDLTANVLVLDRSMNWNSGQGITLRFRGTAPDIGALEYAPPTALTPPVNVRISRQ